MEFTYLSGQSPIDPDERAGLIPQHITTMGNSTTSKQQTSPKQAYGFKPSETPTLYRLSSFGHCIRKCSARFGVGRGNITGQTRTLADHGMRFQCESRSFCGMSNTK